MNRENLEKWLVDLETTEEPQTRGGLTNRQGDCCLGRLCKVAIRDDVPVQTSSDEGEIFYDGRMGTPPPLVQQWLGNPRPIFFMQCTEWNDEQNLSFREIAAQIRKEYT